MAIISQKILARALQKLQEESWPLDKVVIQKVIYYLKTQGLPIEWHFEAYTYGPFSFSLSSELTSMTYCERLDEDNNRYTIKDLNKLELEVELVNAVDQAVDRFRVIVENKNDFKTMELFSTVLYCQRALENSVGKASVADVLSDFKEWKDGRYSDQQIKHALGRFQ